METDINAYEFFTSASFFTDDLGRQALITEQIMTAPTNPQKTRNWKLFFDSLAMNEGRLLIKAKV